MKQTKQVELPEEVRSKLRLILMDFYSDMEDTYESIEKDSYGGTDDTYSDHHSGWIVDSQDDAIKQIEAILAQAQQEAVEKSKLEAYKDVMAFRSVYLYDDYSSLYQHSKELQKEYYEKMGEFLKQKIGLNESNRICKVY